MEKNRLLVLIQLPLEGLTLSMPENKKPELCFGMWKYSLQSEGKRKEINLYSVLPHFSNGLYF